MSEETIVNAYSIFKVLVFLTAIICLSIAGIGYLLKKGKKCE